MAFNGIADKTEYELRTAREERDKALREKESAVSELNQRMQSMALAYEALVHVNFSNVFKRFSTFYLLRIISFTGKRALFAYRKL